jgi:hypothetical protein
MNYDRYINKLPEQSIVDGSSIAGVRVIGPCMPEFRDVEVVR